MAASSSNPVDSLDHVREPVGVADLTANGLGALLPELVG